MKVDLIKSWIKALKEGNYRQATHKLRTLDGCYCVMGVAMDVHPEKDELWRDYKADKFGSEIPPEFVLDDYGLSERALRYKVGIILTPVEPVEYISSHVIALNDSGVDFPTLAKHIELFYKEIGVL